MAKIQAKNNYMAKDNLGLEVVKEGELLKWDITGTKVVGVLKSYTPRKTAMGDGHIYEVRTKDGIAPFFAPSLLHKKLSDVAIGNIVSIEYTKKTKTGAGTDLKHFEVAQGKPTVERLKALGIEMTDKNVELDVDKIDL